MILTRRALLPVLAAIPFHRTAPPETIPRPKPPKRTRILFGGDVMLSRYVGRLARAHHDPAAPFSDRGRFKEHGMIFKAEPEMIAALQTAGVSIVSTANNHARDCDGYGVEFTLSWLNQHGIMAVGSAATAEAAHSGTVIELKG